MPYAPKIITIANNGTGNSLDFTFKKSGDDTGAGDYYDIRWSVNSNMSSAVISSQYIPSTGAANYTGTTPTTLSGNTQYYFQVRFEDASARSHSSWADAAGQDYATTSGAAPATPGAPEEANVTYEEIDLEWDAVSGASSYKLYYGTGTSDPSSNYFTVAGTTKTHSGLDEAQNYSYRLKATNANGDSGYGPKFTQSTLWEDEGDIAVNSGIGNDYESNTITWTVPTSDAGSDESKLYGEINDTTPDVLISTQSGTGTKSYHHTGLTQGGTYSYRIRLYVGVHNDHYSNRPVTTVTNPGAPVITSVSFSNIGDTTATVTWADNNALSFKYLVSTIDYASTSYSFSQNMSTNGVNNNFNTVNLTGLTENTAYRFYIIPYQYTSNGYPIGATYGFGSNPEGYQTLTTGVSVPDAPGAVTVTAKTFNTINLSWSAVTDATGYKLYYTPLGNSSPTGPGTTQSGTTKNFSSLQAATTYYFRIKAYNAGGDSGYSPTLTVDTTTVTPSIPVASSNVDPTEQVITWPIPAGTYYSYLYGTGNNSTNQLQAKAASSVETHTQATTPGSTYYYRTRTVTTNHNSLYSAYGPQLTAVAASVAVPSNISYTATSISTITFSWTNPTYTGRTYVYSADHSDALIDLGNPDYSTGTSVLIDGQAIQTGPPTTIDLEQNERFQIKLKNYYDTHYSSFTSTFAGYTLPGPPTSATAADLSDTEILVGWNTPAGSALSEVFEIDHRIDNTGDWVSRTQTATGTSYEDINLVQGTAYYYRIRTKTDAGYSTSYAYSNDTTQTGPDPVAGDDLKLGALGYATGVNGNATTSTSINACNGNAGTEAEFKDFYCGAVGTLSGTQYVWKGSSTTFTANFSNKGTLFNSRIGIEDGNFTWSSSNTNIATVEANADRTCLVTTTSAGGTATITMTYAGRYNQHSSIPNQSRQRTITGVG
jgi:hypothetical protein